MKNEMSGLQIFSLMLNFVGSMIFVVKIDHFIGGAIGFLMFSLLAAIFSISKELEK